MRELKITRKKSAMSEEDKKIPKSKSVGRELDPIKSKESTIPKSYGVLKALVDGKSFKDLPEDKQSLYKSQLANFKQSDPVTVKKPKTLQEKNDGIKSFLENRYNKK